MGFQVLLCYDRRFFHHISQVPGGGELPFPLLRLDSTNNISPPVCPGQSVTTPGNSFPLHVLNDPVHSQISLTKSEWSGIVSFPKATFGNVPAILANCFSRLRTPDSLVYSLMITSMACLLNLSCEGCSPWASSCLGIRCLRMLFFFGQYPFMGSSHAVAKGRLDVAYVICRSNEKNFERS